MLGFLYSILLKLLYPTSIAIILLLLSAFFRRRAALTSDLRHLPSDGPRSPLTSDLRPLTSGWEPPLTSDLRPLPSDGPRSPLTSDLRPLTSVSPPSDLRHLTSEFWSRKFFWSAIAVLLICGNGWVVKYSTRYLERQYPPLTSDLRPLTSDLTSDLRPLTSVSPPSDGPRSSLPAPRSEPPSDLRPLTPDLQPADAILVLGGGTRYKLHPRQTVEVSEAGDRILYAAHLFRTGQAPKVLCTSGIGTGGIGPGPAADTMAELLLNVGVPESAIIRETASRNTHEHGRNLQPMLQDLGFRRILLVTSAMHMPRSIAVFKRSCPGIEFIPAPTDYRVDDTELPFYRQLVSLIPTPSAYVQFSETMHEYLGILVYNLRGWL